MRKFCPGFTLIELLVSISVVAIISGIGLAAFVQFNRRQIVSSATRLLLDDLRLAQGRATSGEKPEGCDGDLLGYQLDLYEDHYELKAVCSGNFISIKSIAFISPVKKISGFSKIKFKTLRQGVEIEPQAESSIILKGFNVSTKISVGGGGEILVE